MRTILLASAGIFFQISPTNAQTVDVPPANTAEPDAADSDTSPEAQIVVTGSLIPRTDLNSPSPVVVLDAEALNGGDTNVVRVLNRLPSFAPDRGPTASNSAFPGSYVNLRDLGFNRTLVLVNGRRYMSTILTGAVDVATIPLELVERVDIVTGGASATYGSDAIAGVVNFILRRSFDGLEFNARTGVTDRGEDTSTRVSVTGGGDFADDRGSAYFHVSYDRTHQILGTNRDFANKRLINDGGELVEFFSVPARDAGAGSSTLGGGSQFDTSGELFSAPGVVNPFGPADYFNVADFSLIQQPAAQVVVATGLRYGLTDAIEFYAEGQYVNSKIDGDYLSDARNLSGMLFSLDNPFIGPLTRAALAPTANADGFFRIPGLSRRFEELGGHSIEVDRNSYRIVTGLRADLGADWSADGYFQYQESSFITAWDNYIHLARLSQGLDVVTGSDGTPVCRNPANGCVPVNIFGPGQLSPQAADFIRGSGNVKGRNSDTIVSATVTGPLMQLPAGPLGFAGGVEYRKSKASESPSSSVLRGETTIGAFGAPIGLRETYEVFGEVNVPLLSEMPFAHYLGFDGGVRYSEFPNAGHAWTYKALLEYAPIEQVRFRGGIQRALRQPSVGELTVADQVRFTYANDPCFIRAPLSGTARAACLSQGFPAALADAGASNPFYEAQYRSFGSPEIDPEIATSYTIGVVVTDVLARRLSFTVDYFDITLDGAIGRIGLGRLIRQCYDTGTGTADTVSPTCSAFERNPENGQITLIKDDLGNVGEQVRRGIDIGANYRFYVPSMLNSEAQIGLNVIGSVLLEASTLPFAGDPTSQYNCAGYYGGSCRLAQPTWRSYSRVSWDDGPVGVALAWQWIGRSKDILTKDGPEATAALARTSLPNTHYFDLRLRYDVNDALELRGGIDNMFDQRPRLVGVDRTNFGTNAFVPQYDQVGRRFWVSASLRFD